MSKNVNFKLSYIGLAFNVIFCIYHIVLGVATRSWWLLTIGTYYIILSVMRTVVLRSRLNKKSIMRFSGIMLVSMVVPLTGTVILASLKDRGTKFHMIVMIGIAVFAFTKITVAIINLIKLQKCESIKMIILRNISFVTALVSIFSLQRSMLVSFEGMSELEIRIMNISLGIGVCVLVLIIGINLLHRAKNLNKEEDL